MNRDAYLDTHIIVNLARKKAVTLSRTAVQIFESSQLLFSPAVELELAFLYEIRRIKVNSDEILNRLRQAIDLQPCPLPFSEVILASKSLSWTRDVFDRLIVGHAVANGQAPLITFDSVVHEHYKRALS